MKDIKELFEDACENFGKLNGTLKVSFEEKDGGINIIREDGKKISHSGGTREQLYESLLATLITSTFQTMP